MMWMLLIINSREKQNLQKKMIEHLDIYIVPFFFFFFMDNKNKQ